MDRHDYEHEVKQDLYQWLKDEHLPYKDVKYKEDLTERLRDDCYDDAFVSDAVTGNASGSYYCNAWKAEEALCHNLDLLGEALEEFGCGPEYMAEKGPEACDVTIRCYLLGQVFDEVWSEIKDELPDEPEEEEDKEENK